MQKTKVWAHRGASGWDKQYAPENTMPAFKKAIEMGADGIELDIQLTKDGEIVIVHDEKIDRVSNGTGWIKDYTLAEIKKFNFNRTHPEYKFIEIPTLKEFFMLMLENSLSINIELKTGIVYYDGLEDKVVNLARNMGMEDRVIYSSFNHYSLKILKQIQPKARIGLLYSTDFVSVPDYPRILDAIALHPPIGAITNEFVERCQQEDLALHVWTVDVKTEMKRMCDLGVDAFITNCPDYGRKIADGDLSIIPGFKSTVC